MDKLHEEKLRAEFEKQIREDLLFDDEELVWQPERNCYEIYGVHLAWWGYRASRVNSPELPDGWVMVPKEPTESMIIDGFESEPDKYFSDKDDWKAYKEMSGCKQAAHRAKLCWNAMLAAAPKPEK